MLDTAMSWSRVSDYIASAMGLHFPGERLQDLKRGLSGAAAEFGFDDAAACADWMLTAPLSPADLHVLAGHLTIGETYFFRDEKLFDALAGTVLPALLRAREGKEQRLRLWSAGCCTGEEAYSLAILLHQLIPDLARWHVSILATDINIRFLRKAAAGAYGEWSFRNAPAGFKERWFQRTADGQYLLVPEVKRLVTFAPSNLVEDAFPALATDTNAMDLILCRNVLMYFTPAQASKVVGKLHRALVGDGWLAVSPSEASRELFPQFAIRNFPGVILFNKAVTAGGRLAFDTPAPWMPPPPSVEPAALELPTAEPTLDTTASTPALAPPAPAPSDSQAPRALLLEARALANEGRLTEALAACDRWIAADKIDAAGHYLRALVLLELGDADAANGSLQRTLYLNPNLVAAHFTLGNLARGRGLDAQADRHFRNALHLLARHRSDDPVPESDGLTAGRFGEIIRELIAVEQPS
jgi:chemotaxis protein methyltransferase CheR